MGDSSTVSKNTLIFSIVISTFLSAMIVGSVVFAWQNSEERKSQIFTQQLLLIERGQLELQLRDMDRGAVGQ